MSGPPGSGKTMLARRMPGILPPLTMEERIEVTKVHSASGEGNGALVTRRPFRAPHHCVDLGARGGGSNPRPGRCRWRTTACSSSTNCPSSVARRWKRYASPWRMGR